jgi:hypothetical protein
MSNVVSAKLENSKMALNNQKIICTKKLIVILLLSNSLTACVEHVDTATVTLKDNNNTAHTLSYARTPIEQIATDSPPPRKPKTKGLKHQRT